MHSHPAISCIVYHILSRLTQSVCLPAPEGVADAHARPDWLATAAVFAAYAWPDDLADEEMLARLLALNLRGRGRTRIGRRNGSARYNYPFIPSIRVLLTGCPYSATGRFSA